jgi:hypothetical protein
MERLLQALDELDDLFAMLRQAALRPCASILCLVRPLIAAARASQQTRRAAELALGTAPAPFANLSERI